MKALTLAISFALLVGPSPQLMAQTRNPLFEQTSSPAVISQQVRLALPSAERGLQLLTGGGDASQLALAVEAIGNTYKYLRAAQESTDLLVRRSKFPDPLAQIEMKKMWDIRMHMLACTNQAGHILKQDQEMITMCAQHVTEGIRQLRILVATLP
jgi:hypothetical protein